MLYGRRPNGHFTTRNAIPENGEILRMAEIRSRKFAKYARKRSPAAAQWETQPVGNSARGEPQPSIIFFLERIRMQFPPFELRWRDLLPKLQSRKMERGQHAMNRGQIP